MTLEQLNTIKPQLTTYEFTILEMVANGMEYDDITFVTGLPVDFLSEAIEAIKIKFNIN